LAASSQTKRFIAATVIISSVSRFFILLLIVLLPLRGWSADLMGTQMATGQAAMSADCPMMAGVMIDMQSAHSNNAHSDGTRTDGDMQRNCQSCQLCMPVIALEFLTIDSFLVKPQAPQVYHLSRIVSAELERAVKPPIS
jgi:hypothetical protein